MFSVEKLKLRLQPYSNSIRLSTVPGLVDVAEIGCLSCLTVFAAVGQRAGRGRAVGSMVSRGVLGGGATPT